MHLIRICIALVALGLTIVEPGISQTVMSSREKSLEMRPAPPPDWRGASVSADTARMSPGHLDFGRYDPEQCLRAVLHVRSHRYRHTELDTLRYVMEDDTLPTIAVDTGRACSALFHDADVPVHQLGSLIRLYLAVHEDARASATATRWLAMNLSPTDRAEALYTIAAAYITASPIRLDTARAIIATIDSMGPSMAILQLRVHTVLLAHWRRSFNTTEMRKESELILAIAERGLGKYDGPEQRGAVYSALGTTLYCYTDVLAYEEGRGRLEALRDRILNAAGDDEMRVWMRNMEVRIGRYVDQIVGTPFPDVHPDWIINGGSSPQRPRAGRVTVVAVVRGPERKTSTPSMEFSNYAVLRRLADRYGSRGLDIVLVTQTRGYSAGSLVQTEEEELKSIEDLYLKYQKIPATILVNKTSFNKLPDGRLIPKLTPLMEKFGNGVLIVDQDGVIRWFTQGAYGNEAQIDAYVESLLSNGAAIRSTNSSTKEMNK